MEAAENDVDEASANSEMDSWHQLPAEDEPSQLQGQISGLPDSKESQQKISLCSDEQLSIIGASSRDIISDRFESSHLEFQDSRLSPALTLFPQGKTFIFSESTLLHQTDSEFVPLRGSPDLSVTSERCPQMSHLDMGVHSSFQHTFEEQASLSQHPLGATTISEGDNSCCSLSLHSLSLDSHYQSTHAHDGKQVSELENKAEGLMKGEKLNDPHLNKEEIAVCALSGSASDVTSKSAMTSHPETALSQSEVLNQAISSQNQCKQRDLVREQNTDWSSAEKMLSKSSCNREQPQGGSSLLSQKKTTWKVDVSLSSHESATSFITVRSSGMQPNCRSQRQSQSYSDSVSRPESRSQSENTDTSNSLCVTPASKEDVYLVEHKQAVWSSGSQMIADDSFLAPQPVSQSTPAVLTGRAAQTQTKHQNTIAAVATSTENGTSKAGQIMPLDQSPTDPQAIPVVHVTSSNLLDGSIESHISSFQHDMLHNQKASVTRLDMPAFQCKDTHSDSFTLDGLLTTSDIEFKDQKSMLSAGRVRSLPSLSYLQKVDAWKANQNSSLSFNDNLALQGFDIMPPKKKEQESLSEPAHHTATQSRLQGHSRATALGTSTCTQRAEDSSRPGSGSVRLGNVVGKGGAGGHLLPSPLTQSHSYSSLSTVIALIQQDGAQAHLQLPKVDSDDNFSAPNSAGVKLSQLSSGVRETSPVIRTGANRDPAKPYPLLGLGQFSETSVIRNVDSALSSSQSSYHGEQSLRASGGAPSSVVSLEVDNYAPYWTSRPGSPQHIYEINIEDRIPTYLRNLGIDQSPSTILNPFTPRGPIREPEFSPTDLCTIKGSVGTPTKSTQPSEGESPQKETFSSSSVSLADSSASLTHQLAKQEQDRPASPGSVRIMRCQMATPPELHTVPRSCTDPQESHTPVREGSYGLHACESLGPVFPPGACLEVEEGDSSLIGSGTLQEIRRLLGRAESLMSAHSSQTSSPGSCCYPESDVSFLSLRQRAQEFHDDSFLSVGGNASLARSYSDSALKVNSSSARGTLQLSTQSDRLATAPSTPSQIREEDMKSRDRCVAPRRAEPEGCSAADPDRVGAVSLSVTQENASSSADDHQQGQESSENTGVSSSESSPTHSPAEVELDVLSDSSSESSLAARVATLLQSESSVSMVTSWPSTTDPEESRAREWILMKASGRQCETLELNAEDRKRIEEIKQELLHHAKQTKLSSDSEASVQSSTDGPPQPVSGFAAGCRAEDHPSKKLQVASQNLLDTAVVPHTPTFNDLGAKVREIALREGFTLPITPASISIATTRHVASSKPLSYSLLKCDDLPDVASELEPSSSQRSSHATPRSAAENISQQGLVCNRGTEMEKNATVINNKKGNGKDEHKESMCTDQSVSQELAHEDSTGRREIPPRSESPSVPPLKPQMSHIHLTLSPNPQPSITQIPPSSAGNFSELETGSLTHQLNSESTLRGAPFSSGRDEHASLTSETSLSKGRHAFQGLKTAKGSSQISPRYPQSFSTGQDTSHIVAVPTLLPYKPHGSSELFYMPQTDPELSPIRSDTSKESSHPGSDDAVPPRFNAEVLGSRELEDNNITAKHKEGIYSKRAKMKSGSTISGGGFHDSEIAVFNQADRIGHFYHLASPSTSGDPAKDLETLQCVQRFEEGKEEDEEEEFAPLHMEADYSPDDLHHHRHSVPKYNLASEVPILPSQPFKKGEQGVRTLDHFSMDNGGSLDQLWRRFSERWSLRETQPTNEAEVSLLERLERLSRFLQSSSTPPTPAEQPQSQEKRAKIRRREHELRKSAGQVTSRGEGGEMSKTVWEEEPTKSSQTVEEAEGQENAHHCPAERDESASVSVETSSLSTIDTQRLLRAFGPQRLNSRAEVSGGQRLKTSGSLLRLYNTINKQKNGHNVDVYEPLLVSTASEIISTDDSTASADALFSISTSDLTPHRGTAHTINAKRPKVKLVSKGIQAGDLEIVVNGTRRHTRDVGTNFPSPGIVRDNGANNAEDGRQQASDSVRAALIPTPTQAQTMLAKKSLNKSSQRSHHSGVSWYVETEKMKWDAPKENEPQDKPVGNTWFKSHSRTWSWRESQREPLRERHIQVEPPVPKASTETHSNGKPSALLHLSLQEALELHRPEFVSRSRERMKRLHLLAEERRRQAEFNREREELFNRPVAMQQLTAVPVPVLSKRVIPLKEMVQRSKRIYHQLPEVQKRREEERRRAEYHSYRLNAQLFNKKVTNRILGRRLPWQ